MNPIQRYLVLGFLMMWGCASAPVNTPAGPEDKPKAELLPHANGVEVNELRALFRLPNVPAPESLEKCDFDYQVEKKLSGGNKQQLFVTFPQYVISDPAKYHWCFYSRLLQLQDQSIEGEAALARLEFLADVSRIMQADLHDSHYLQLTRRAYQEISVWSYFTPVKPSSNSQEEP